MLARLVDWRVTPSACEYSSGVVHPNRNYFAQAPTGSQPNKQVQRGSQKRFRHLNLTDDSEKPIGQWNKMEIVCKGDEIIVRNLPKVS